MEFFFLLFLLGFSNPPCLAPKTIKCPRVHTARNFLFFSAPRSNLTDDLTVCDLW